MLELFFNQYSFGNSWEEYIFSGCRLVADVLHTAAIVPYLLLI